MVAIRRAALRMRASASLWYVDMMWSQAGTMRHMLVCQIYKSRTASSPKTPSRSSNPIPLHSLANQQSTITMKFTTSAVLATSAALVSAVSAGSPFPSPGPNDVFNIIAIRPGSFIHYASTQAKGGHFTLGALIGRQTRSLQPQLRTIHSDRVQRRSLLVHTTQHA
jgi:hypothetical protein